MRTLTWMALIGLAFASSSCALDRRPQLLTQAPGASDARACSLDCDDRDPCTVDSCVSAVCRHSPQSGCLADAGSTVVDTGVVDSGLPAPPDATISSADSSAGLGPPRCITRGSQVVALGDSYVNYLPGISITPILTVRAVSAQILQPLDSFRDYAQPGAALGVGGLPGVTIPPQLDHALMDDPDIRAVYLTGGGSDVLIGPAECREVGAAALPICRAIVAIALQAARTLLDHAAEADIRDVIYFFYPYLRQGLPLAGNAPNEMLDYAYPLAEQLCDDAEQITSGRTRCHFIDLRPIFAGHTEEWINGIDGVHTTPAGAQVIAATIWNRMQQECIGQLASSGCCQP